MTTPANSGQRILLVDDEELIAESIRQILELDHHVVEAVSNGHAALAAFKAARFDLVIIDYKMPGMQGDKLATAIRELAPQQPILMLTAFGEMLRHGGEFPLAVSQVMGKPFEAQELRDAVQRLSARA